MTCSRCQTINPAGSVTCASCGAPLVAGAPYTPPPAYQQPPPGYPNYPGQPGYPQGGYMMMPQPVQSRTSGMAIAGFVLAFFCNILGLIFSMVGLSQIKKSNGELTGSGFAIAGIVISVISLIINVIYVIAIIKYGADADRNSDWD